MDRNDEIFGAGTAAKLSLSARRAWIEIRLADMSAAWNRSLSARRAWIEILAFWCIFNLYESLSARRAWIEITPSSTAWQVCRVALRKESVDRNPRSKPRRRRSSAVALRKESVDRNLGINSPSTVMAESLSARRAWIEILWAASVSSSLRVALRKESVDRNLENKSSSHSADGRSPQGERG